MFPVGSSTKKSASTWDFALVLCRYSKSYSLNSTAHLASVPDWLHSPKREGCEDDDGVGLKIWPELSC